MRYEILNDEVTENPRKETDSTFGTILYTSSRYELGDEKVDGEEIQRKLKDPSVIALPVYAYIHSNVMLNTTGFNDLWDSGKSGCIYVSKEEVCRLWNFKRISSARLKWVKESLQKEIEIYSNYLSGEVYGYRIFDDQDNEIESCWGFYGLEYAKQEAEAAVKNHALYVPPSPKAFTALAAGIKSAKLNPHVVLTEDFSQYANDI